jgi:hypothetical protein
MEISSLVSPAGRISSIATRSTNGRQLLWVSRAGRRGICRDVQVNCADEGLLPSSNRATLSRNRDRVRGAIQRIEN